MKEVTTDVVDTVGQLAIGVNDAGNKLTINVRG